MVYLPGLAAALAAFWFALSGQTAPLFIALGVLSLLASLYIAARLRVIDRDASPYHRSLHLLAYLGWLMVEIVKANIAVIRSVLGPRATISPALVKLDASCDSDLAMTLYSNSITLTPGTVTVDIDKGIFVVHALQGDTATPASFAPMDRRASRAADGDAQ